jgi:hypothetical protein
MNSWQQGKKTPSIIRLLYFLKEFLILVPCKNSMAHPWVANIFNKQSRIAEKWWFSSLRAGRGYKPLITNKKFWEKAGRERETGKK